MLLVTTIFLTLLLTGFCESEVPIQLVRPAANHRDLELVPESLASLSRIDGPVALVAVVGKFHSGKSFLMNQLMGKSMGFGIGPSVEPKTMGIWMWGQPMQYVSSRIGKKLSLVFLDTEGFAASNITENYDAKVFAVSTLMSSHLIYNSVKIIDQSDIDYLELLARRTQLFALRSQLSKSKWTEFDLNMLSFPPLTWVVQDFAQDTAKYESPTDWLHRLMAAHSRESDNYTISLLDIFEDVDCHTLFIPAFERDLLMDLSQAGEENLSDVYRKERDQLIKKLKNKIKPKEKAEKFVTGKDLAKLLSVLVTAANDGSLADVPSRWDSFVERLQSTASDDCNTFYNRELDAYLIGTLKDEPTSMRQFDLQHQHIKSRAFELLDHLLHGLDDALIIARRDLGTAIEATHSTKRDLNEKKIKVKANEIKTRLEIVAEDQIKRITLPMKSSHLHKQIESIFSQLVVSFQNELVDLLDEESLRQLGTAFEKSLNLLKVSVESSNRQAMQSAIDKVKTTILNSFRQGQDQGRIARKPSVLNKILEQMIKNSDEDFRAKTLQFHEEDLYAPALALFTQQLNNEAKIIIKKNEDVAAKNIQAATEKLASKFSERTKFSLPMDESNLNSRLSQEGNLLVDEFQTQFEDFATCCDYEAQLAALKKAILAVGHQRQHENIKAYTAVVDDAFKRAKKIIKGSEENFTNLYSFKKFVNQVSSDMLSQGKSASWEQNLKDKVINEFINGDTDIQAMMESKRGLLASIVGFIQYLLSFIGL